MGKDKTGVKLIANNKKAYHDFFIEEKIEAGIALYGTEIKSLRQGKCSVKESYIGIENGEAFIYGMQIPPYEKGNIFNRDPLRIRRLLLNKKEIRKISDKLAQQGLTLVPLKIYINEDGRAKMEIATCRGKKLYDKRADIAKRDADRRMQRAVRR